VAALLACGLALTAGVRAATGAAGARAGNAAAADTGPDAATPGPAPHAAGRFVWQDLVTNDVNACRNFYGALLGWQFQETERNGRPYLIARAQGRLVGGIIQRQDTSSQRAAWLSFLAVDDLERAVAMTTAAGGKVLREPVALRGLGRFAAVTDPQGAPLGLAHLDIEPPAGIGEGAEGQFFWREYFARDAESALAFYRQLNGYDDRPAQRARVEYHILERDGPQAGLLPIPEAFGGVTPNWLPYVRVADPRTLADRVESLGGRVLLPPQEGIRNGAVAIVADPTGGVVALQKWPL
jgi:predicted enzyme related to lactoylglutathione lyase